MPTQNNADIDAIWSWNANDTAYPLPSSVDNPNPALLLGDLTLYTVGNFSRQILNSNLLPRFAQDMLAAGVNNANLSTYVDGTAVAQVVTYPLYPQILTQASYKFPLLSVCQTGMQSNQLTLVKTSIKRDFSISWILPPMDGPQLNRFQPYLSIAAKALQGFLSQGYDPKISTINNWKTAGVSYGTVGDVSLKPFIGRDKDGRDIVFPTLTISLSLIERNQLGLTQNYPNNFTSATLQLDLVDGYNPANPIINFIDGYITPNITVSNVSPNAGTIQGGTLITLTGTGFNILTKQITVCGAPTRGFQVISLTQIQFITSPGIAVGVGDIVFTDNQNNTTVIPGVFTYES